MYSPPEGVAINATLSGYCVAASCYKNNVSNGTNSSALCNPTYCEMESPVPTVPDIDDNRHWFFDIFLYIGGAVHLSMSLAMVISYFLINAGNFVLPDFMHNLIKPRKPQSMYVILHELNFYKQTILHC